MSMRASVRVESSAASFTVPPRLSLMLSSSIAAVRRRAGGLRGCGPYGIERRCRGIDGDVRLGLGWRCGCPGHEAGLR